MPSNGRKFQVGDQVVFAWVSPERVRESAIFTVTEYRNRWAYGGPCYVVSSPSGWARRYKSVDLRLYTRATTRLDWGLKDAM